MIETPEIVETDAQLAAVVHQTIPRDQMPVEMPKAIQELTNVLGEQRVRPQGPLFAHHLTMPSQTFDVEVGFLVTERISPAGRVTAKELPTARLVRTVYRGEYEGLAGAWQEFMMEARERLTATGLWMSNTIRETYLTGPEPPVGPLADLAQTVEQMGVQHRLAIPPAESFDEGF